VSVNQQVVDINLTQASYQVRQALTTAEQAMGRAEYGEPFAQPYDRVKVVPQRAGAVYTAYRASSTRVIGDSNANNAVKNAAIIRLKELANNALEGLEGSLVRDIANVRKSLPMPVAATPEERTAYAAEAGRIWDRTRAQLAAGVDLGEIIQRADWPTINVLGEEVAAWYAVQYPSSPRMADDMTVAARAQIDVRRYEMADVAERAKLDKIRELDRGETFSRTAIEYVRASLGDGVPVTLPTWEGSAFTAG
jgi:hypothetical protein